MMKTENSSNGANYKDREPTAGVVVLIITVVTALLILVVKLHYMM